MNYYIESFADEARAALNQGALVGLGDNRVAFVSRLDLAAAAAGLIGGDRHEGAIYTGTGSRAWTVADRVALVARLSGRPLVAASLTAGELRARFAQAGLPPEIVEVAVSIRQGFVDGGFDIVTGDIETLSGRPPRTLHEVLAAALGHPPVAPLAG